MNGLTISLPGYDIGTGLIHPGGRIVFRAARREDQAPVLIHTLKSQYPDSRQIAEIKREAEIAISLRNIAGVIGIYGVESYGSGNLALITEPFQYSLADILANEDQQDFTLRRALRLGIQLVHILDQVHKQGIIHKALTPEHILIDETTDEVRLSGFGIASELSREHQAGLSERLEGPLPYISPEQTGRMQRDLDYRSDYYSLGVTLFEMLTGTRPFEADNVLEWVHQHISRTPPIPGDKNSDIPDALSWVVLKLLAKDPDERYQSAQGIVADLEYCDNLLDNKANSDSHFEPGRHDVSQVFLLPQNLYGRDEEQSQLMSVFDSSLRGQSELCLVHGYSGIGKSALIQDIGLRLVREHGFLIQGKFDQFNQGNAYGGLASAFRRLIQQTLAAPKKQLQLWKDALLSALGANAQLIIDLVPELELIIGEQAPVVELPPVETRNRFQIALASFVSIFATANHPLVLFLDDLQWSDTPTLDALKHLLTSRDISHLLVIGAYRSNEVGPGHPLTLIIEEIRQVKTICEVPLKPLKHDAVNALVADALRSNESHVSPLTDLLYDKAQGNPFFTVELIKKLHEDGAIFRNETTDQWQWNLDSAMWSRLPDDVVEFMADNLRQLPEATQTVLQLAACIGNTFNLFTLSIIHECSPKVTAQALFQALKHHMIIPLHPEYKLVNGEPAHQEKNPVGNVTPEFNPSYQFLHDRVQQAAYSLIGEEQTQAVHKSIGQLMLLHAHETHFDERLIDIAGHLNIARPIITDPEERLELVQLNLDAGQRARTTAAYETAMELLRAGEELLPDDAWAKHYTLTMNLSTELQQCAYLTARLNEAEERMDTMLKYADSDFKQAEFLATRTRQYATLGKMEASIHSAIRGLVLLGVNVSHAPTQEDITNERRSIDATLLNREIMDLVDAPTATDQNTLIANRLLMEIFPAAFLSGSGNLFQYLVLKAVNLSLRNGNSPESAFAYAAFGMLLCGELDEQGLGYKFGKLGLAINERLDDIELQTRVIYVYAMFIHHWSEHWTSLTPWFRKGIKSGYQSGDLLYLAYSAQDCVIWDPTLDLMTQLTQHTENLEIVRETGYQDSIDSATLYLQLLNNFLGWTSSAESLTNQSFNETSCLKGMHERKFMTGIANYHIYKAEACFLHGAYQQALEHIREQDKLIKSAMSLPQLVRFYIVAFLTLSTTFPEMSSAEQEETLLRLKNDLKRMRQWAKNCPDNFLHLRRLMEAEYARLTAPNEFHLQKYEAAIAAASASGFLRDEAMACERAARYLLEVGLLRGAEGYLRTAHHAYSRWGGLRKIATLEKEFPILQELSGNYFEPRNDYGYGGIDTKNIDLATVMKASRAISGEIVLSRLMQTILDILLENAGAQWGCFVVHRDGGLSIEAQSGPQPQHDSDSLIDHSVALNNNAISETLPVTVVSHALRTSNAVILHDAAHEGAFTEDPYISTYKPESILCVPVQRSHIQGVVYMENNLTTNAFTESRLEIISLLTAQASVAIENAGLYEQVQDYSRTLEEKVATRTAQLEELNDELKKVADSDGLTGLANRRRLDTYINEKWYRVRRNQGPLSIIIFDVDHFKNYNDTYGHQAGDECLVSLSSAAQRPIRRTEDLLARYGGEEFVIVLPDTDNSDALVIAEQVRQSVENMKIPHSKSTVGKFVTVSIGVATTLPDVNLNPESLIKIADQALYKAKKLGRNQVQSADVQTYC